MAGKRGSSFFRRLKRLLLWLVALSAVGIAGYLAYLRFRLPTGSDEDAAVTHTVSKGTLHVAVTERGNLESQKTVDGVCEMQGYQNKIIFIAEEGSQVEKDQVVVRFDSSELDKSIAEQEIQVNQAKGDVDAKRQELQVQKNQNESDIAAAELELKLATLDLKKYRDGDYLVKLNELKGKIALSESELEKAKTNHDHMQELVKGGFREPEQLQAAKQSMLYANFNLQRDTETLRVLENFEYERFLTEHTSKAREAERKLARVRVSAEAQQLKAEAALASAEAAARLKSKRMDELLDQKGKCEIKAAQPGIVAFANKEHWDESRQIREGAVVHERQTIFHLPDMSSMQVKVNVHESVVKKVKAGQKATIRVDAFPNITLTGTVKKVSPLADSSNFWSSGGVKEYTTYVVMDELPGLELRPGMTAEVEIEVGKFPDALLVPTQAVTQKGKDHYAFAKQGDTFESLKVKVGESNHKYVQVLEGLAPGAEVALNAYSRALEKFGKESLTDTEDEEQKEGGAAQAEGAQTVPAPAVAVPSDG